MWFQTNNAWFQTMLRKNLNMHGFSTEDFHPELAQAPKVLVELTCLNGSSSTVTRSSWLLNVAKRCRERMIMTQF